MLMRQAAVSLLAALVAITASVAGVAGASAKILDISRPNQSARETTPPTVREHNQTGPRPNPIVKHPHYPHPGGGYVAPPFQGARDHRTLSQTPRGGGKQ